MWWLKTAETDFGAHETQAGVFLLAFAAYPGDPPYEWGEMREPQIFWDRAYRCVFDDPHTYSCVMGGEDDTLTECFLDIVDAEFASGRLGPGPRRYLALAEFDLDGDMVPVEAHWNPQERWEHDIARTLAWTSQAGVPASAALDGQDWTEHIAKVLDANPPGGEDAR